MAHGRGSVASPAVLVGLLHDQMVMKMSWSPGRAAMRASGKEAEAMTARVLDRFEVTAIQVFVA